MSLLTQVFYLSALYRQHFPLIPLSLNPDTQTQAEEHQPHHIWWISTDSDQCFCFVCLGLGFFFRRSKEIKFTLQMNQGSNPYWKIKGFYHNGELQHRVRRQGELCNVPQSPKEKRCTPKLLSDVAIGTSCPCGEEVHREPANAHVLLQWGTWHWAQCFLCMLPQPLNSNILLTASEEYSVSLKPKGVQAMVQETGFRRLIPTGFFPILVWKCWKKCNYLYCICFGSEDLLLISFFQVHPLFSRNYKN